MSSRSAFGWLFLLPFAVHSALGAPKWEMDYGPFLNLSVQMSPKQGGTTAKGLAVRVGEQMEGTIAYDTDLMRCSGAWVGGFVDFKGVAFSGAHGGNPAPVGTVLFHTPAMPGWSKNGSFVDPRPLPKGFGASTVPFGPLPRDWAQYRGLHRNGNRVTLEYSVGGAEILESPTLEGSGAGAAVGRSFHVRKGGEAATLIVAEVPGAKGFEEQGDTVVVREGEGDSVLRVRLLGRPQGARWTMVAPGVLGLELGAFRAGEKFKLVHWRGKADRGEEASVVLKGASAPADLEVLAKPGPLLWAQTVETAGRLGTEEGAYQLDTVTIPFDNPWRSWLRIGGIDFFKDGRIAFSTFAGDVWIGSGIDAGLGKISWKRFAAGLHQPLGLKIVDDQVYLTCRDGLVRLKDVNRDGEADFYEMFNNEVQATPNFHEFMFDLQTDSQGNFYFAKGGPVRAGGRGWDPLSEHHGTVMRVSRDGSKLDVFATGVRAPNGLGMGPGDVLTTGDNEGTWVPMCYVHVIKKGGFVSVPDLAHREQTPTAFDPHVCFMPKSVDNSSGGQVWVTSEKWGAMKGRMLHLSYGQASMYEVMMEEVGGVLQGGVTKVPLKFATGLMRGRFSPVDGELYVAGQRGWQTSGVDDGAIHRVRYTGKPDPAPKGLRVTDKGIHLQFHQPLDPATAGDPDNYGIEQYNYRWTSNYGSKEYRVSNPSELGRDAVDILGVALSADRKSVFLRVDGLVPVMQSEISMRVKTETGAQVPEKIWHTINAVGKETGALPKLTVSTASSNAIKTAGSGVALALKAGGKTDVRRDRLVALHVPAGESVSPFLPAGAFEARWDAVVPSGSRKDVAFHAEGAGFVRVFVGADATRPVLEGDLPAGGKRLTGNISLNKGSNALRVEYKSPGAGDATLRLMWSSSDFREEPVPPAALLFPASETEAVAAGALLREGRQLFAQANCVSCHDAQGVLSAKGAAPHAMPEMSRQAPLLTDLGGRFHQAWLARWIQNPHRYRAGSLMPAVLSGPEAPAQAADIAAFLAGQGASLPAEAPGGDVNAGGVLFGNLGCIACHSTPQSKPGNDFARVSLGHVSSKWKPAALKDYLLDPHKYHPGSRMPKTSLKEEEARNLAAFLLSFPAEQAGATAPGDATRGAQLLATVGCIQCHAGAPGGTAPALAKILTSEWNTGCLADSRDKAGKAPDYRFSADQRAALRVFAKAGVGCVEKDSALEYAQRAVLDLRCVACHNMDARQSVWSAVTEEANMLGALKSSGSKNSTAPRATAAIPSLTWAGEKLQPSWSARMISGGIEHKTRPYLVGRMPAFSGDAGVLARGLSHWHGFSEKENALGDARGGDPSALESGKVLVGDQGGFACTVCHDVGSRPATAPFEAPAVNLAWAGERLRLSYYERWLFQPTRIDADTKMPRYSDRQGKTQLKQTLNGDGEKQFDAIRQYLLSLQQP